MKTKNSNSTFINYEHFARVYLLIAKTSLIARNYDQIKRNTAKDLNKDLDVDDGWRLFSGMIVIPVIYCIRHSIELFLKSLSVGETQSYLQTHNNSTLLSKLGISSYINKEDSKQFLDLIEKYTFYKFPEPIIDPLLPMGIIDTENEIFRYPDNKLGVKIRGENLPLIKSGDLLEDIKNLRNLYSKISSERQTK